MTRAAPWLSWSTASLAVVLALAATVVGPEPGLVQWKLVVVPLFFALPGALIAAGRPGVAVGWLMLAVAVLLGGAAVGGEWATGAGRPALSWAAWWTDRLSAYAVPLALLTLVLLPDGRLPSPRWRVPVTLAVGSQVLLVCAYVFARGPAAASDTSLPVRVAGVLSPVGFLPQELQDAARDLEPWLLELPMLLAVAAVGRRLWRGGQDERLRLGEVLVAAVLFVVLGMLGHALWPAAADVLDVLGAALLGISITVAVLRRRLGGLDVALHHSFVYAVLTLLIALAYVVAVGLLGSAGVDLPPLGQGAVTALIALSVLPVRGWLQRGLSRALYGDRFDPYAAVRRLDAQLSGSTSLADALAGTARTMTSALRLPWASVEVDGRAAEHGARPPGARTVVRSVADGSGTHVTVSVTAWAGRRLTRDDELLLDELARQGGRTIGALLLAEALVASRQELVAAREEERARLRRDLHDELGPTLAGLVMQLGGLRELLEENPRVAAERVPVLEGAARSALDDVRRVSRALRPPALDELGLEGALHDHAGRLGLSVARPSDGLPALPPAVEVAAYRIGAEALTNVARHARATRAELTIGVADSELVLEVRDDGAGWAGDGLGVGMLGMKERAEEVGGRLDIESAEGAGTTVRARLPILSGQTHG